MAGVTSIATMVMERIVVATTIVEVILVVVVKNLNFLLFKILNVMIYYSSLAMVLQKTSYSFLFKLILAIHYRMDG